jgi:hypothetical protein
MQDDLVTVTKVTDENINDILDIFFPSNLEHLTDELISELVGMGYPQKDLLEMRDAGYHYNRARNSFVDTEPPNIACSGRRRAARAYKHNSKRRRAIANRSRAISNRRRH